MVDDGENKLHGRLTDVPTGVDILISCRLSSVEKNKTETVYIVKVRF